MPQPLYTPVSGPGTISPDKQWKFTASGWVPNTVSKPTPISVKEETPAEILPPMPTPGTKEGDLGNLRIALHSALTEAAQQTTKSRLQQMAGMGLLEGDVGSPSFIQAAIGLAQQGLRQTQETVFGDIMQAFKDEQDRLREEGRAPEVIGSSETGYYQWDKNSRGWQPISNVAAGSFDSGLSDDSWVKLIMAGQANITNVKNSNQQNRVATLLADELPDPTNKAWAQKQYDEGKAIDMTDEQIRKDMVKAGIPESIINQIIPAAPKSTPLLERMFRGGAKSPTASVASPFGLGNFSDIHIDDRIAQIKKAMTIDDTGLEKQLTQEGYNPEQIRMRIKKPSILEGYNPAEQLKNIGSTFNIFRQ